MVYQMKLNENPFKRVKNGTKTIEFRLYDEKRRKIKIGDEIEFSKLPDLKDKLVVEVVDIYRNTTFLELFKRVYTGEKEIEIEKKAESMKQYYSYEQERKYGVVGIKISRKKE